MLNNSSSAQDICWPEISCGLRDTSVLDHDGSFDTALTTTNEGILRFPDSCSGSEVNETNYGTNLMPSSIVKDLANLNIALYECAAKLPSTRKTRTHSGQTFSKGTHSSREDLKFVFDDLFRLTTQFIGIVQSVTCLPSQSTELPVGHEQQVSHESPNIMTINYIDEGTIYLIASCHSRLIETYASIFELIQACINFSLPPENTEWAIDLPPLQIGSSIASPPLRIDNNTPISLPTSLLYMFMISELSKRLFQQLGDVVRAGFAGAVEASVTGQALKRTIWGSVNEKNDGLLRTIEETQSLLHR
jgi:hypothetical protein